jgi:hypothetical protein
MADLRREVHRQTYTRINIRREFLNPDRLLHPVPKRLLAASQCVAGQANHGRRYGGMITLRRYEECKEKLGENRDHQYCSHGQVASTAFHATSVLCDRSERFTDPIPVVVGRFRQQYEVPHLSRSPGS